MTGNTIKVRSTESGQTMDVVVLTKRAGQAYADSITGGEVVDERSRVQV